MIYRLPKRTGDQARLDVLEDKLKRLQSLALGLVVVMFVVAVAVL